METILISTLAQYLIPALGVSITALVGYGVSLLKKKTDSDIAKSALDQVDQIVGTVVSQIAQTTAKEMKRTMKDGHLSKEQKSSLNIAAQNTSRVLLSPEITHAAERTVPNLNRYIQYKIEEQVLANKVK